MLSNEMETQFARAVDDYLRGRVIRDVLGYSLDFCEALNVDKLDSGTRKVAERIAGSRSSHDVGLAADSGLDEMRKTWKRNARLFARRGEFSEKAVGEFIGSIVSWYGDVLCAAKQMGATFELDVDDLLRWFSAWVDANIDDLADVFFSGIGESVGYGASYGRRRSLFEKVSKKSKAPKEPKQDGQLSKAQRAKLKPADFVFPDERSWPIHDLKHAKIALAWAEWPQHKSVRNKVRSAVFRRWPQLKKGKKSKKEGLEMGRRSMVEQLQELERLVESVVYGGGGRRRRRRVVNESGESDAVFSILERSPGIRSIKREIASVFKKLKADGDGSRLRCSSRFDDSSGSGDLVQRFSDAIDEAKAGKWPAGFWAVFDDRAIELVVDDWLDSDVNPNGLYWYGGAPGDDVPPWSEVQSEVMRQMVDSAEKFLSGDEFGLVQIVCHTLRDHTYEDVMKLFKAWAFRSDKDFTNLLVSAFLEPFADQIAGAVDDNSTLKYEYDSNGLRESVVYGGGGRRRRRRVVNEGVDLEKFIRDGFVSSDTGRLIKSEIVDLVNEFKKDRSGFGYEPRCKDPTSWGENDIIDNIRDDCLEEIRNGKRPRWSFDDIFGDSDAMNGIFEDWLRDLEQRRENVFVCDGCTLETFPDFNEAQRMAVDNLLDDLHEFLIRKYDGFARVFCNAFSGYTYDDIQKLLKHWGFRSGRDLAESFVSYLADYASGYIAMVVNSGDFERSYEDAKRDLEWEAEEY